MREDEPGTVFPIVGYARQSSFVEETQKTSRQQEVTPKSEMGREMWAAVGRENGWDGRRWERRMADAVDVLAAAAGGGV